MCIFNHFMYFALYNAYKIVFFVRFSHFLDFCHIILMKKILSFRQNV